MPRGGPAAQPAWQRWRWGTPTVIVDPLNQVILLATDGQGRIILRPEQRRLAEIGSPASVVVIGSGSRVEIWQEARWDSYSADAQGRFTESADRVNSTR